MYFVDLDKSRIIKDSEYEDGFYIYTLGTSVNITSIKYSNRNDLLSSSLSKDKKEDALMIRYQPTNKIYFSKAFIESDTTEYFASFSIDEETGNLYVGTMLEFGVGNGLLAFSGYLSPNNIFEEDRTILCTDKMLSSIENRIKVLAIGVRDDKLFGLFFIPTIKGVKLSIKNKIDWGISPVSYKTTRNRNYNTFTIKDWFDRQKIEEVDS